VRYPIYTVIILAVFILSGCGQANDQAVSNTTDALTGLDKVEVKQAAGQDLAVARCQEMFRQKFALGEDMSAGPCLSEEIVDDWACDVAHNPRQAIDDQAANQCQSYRDGRVSHFVELDQSGNLIKAK